jgi:hypothetical protein
MHVPKTVQGASVLQENEKQKNKDVRESAPVRVQSADAPAARKFLKSKSKIFKFWM